VFNVADLCIDVAGALFVVLLIRGVRLDGTRHPHDARQGEPHDQPLGDEQ
jgi:signal peptidase II